MKLKFKNILSPLLLLYFFLSFSIFPIFEIKYFANIIYSLIFVLFCYIKFYKKEKIHFNNSKQYIFFFVLLCICVLSSMIELLDQSYTIFLFIYLLILDIYLRNDGPTGNCLNKHMLIFVLLIAVVSNLYAYYVLNFDNSVDLNTVGILVFFLLAYSYKARSFYGIIIALSYMIISDSRAFELLIVLFAFSCLIKRYLSKIVDKLQIGFGKVIILSTLLIIPFSYYWVFNISSAYTLDYREGLNDQSNRMRFVANIKAFEMIIDDKLITHGYGRSIKEALGVDGPIHNEHEQFLGVRLVQPHNAVINMALRIGIIPTFIYFLYLSTIIKKLFYRDNIPVIIPYLAVNLIMHSLLIYNFLALWIFILSYKNHNECSDSILEIDAK